LGGARSWGYTKFSGYPRSRIGTPFSSYQLDAALEEARGGSFIKEKPDLYGLLGKFELYNSIHSGSNQGNGLYSHGLLSVSYLDDGVKGKLR